LTAHAPTLVRKVNAWMSHLSPTGEPADYFLQPNSFPLLPLIGWAATSFALDAQAQDDTQAADTQFIADVVYSTASMYYYIRLLDNVMDGHATTEAQILPAMAFFHTEFQSAYQRYFPPDHPFWLLFRSEWLAGSEAVARELELASFTRADFETVSVAKLSAARIPVAAVAFRANAADRLAAWDAFTVALSRWSQMEDDLFDWHHDLRHGKSSYFLTEARRNCAADSATTASVNIGVTHFADAANFTHSGHNSDAALAAWIVQFGFDQEIETLRRELFILRDLAETLHSTHILNYLDCRRVMLDSERVRITTAFKTLAEIAGITESRVQVVKGNVVKGNCS
jgi:hypothetical protein